MDFTLERYEFDQVSKIQIYDISGIIFSKRRGEYHVKGVAKILKDIDNDLEVKTAKIYSSKLIFLSNKGRSGDLQIARQRVPPHPIQIQAIEILRDD